MQQDTDGGSSRRQTGGPLSRRRLLRFTGATALAAVAPATKWASSARAQENAVTLTAAASEVSAQPGAASAKSLVAGAVAQRGAARVEAASALAGADDDGATAQGAAALAAAEPDAGALAQSANAVTSASSVSDGPGEKHAPARVSGRGYRESGGRGGGRRIRAARGGRRGRRERIARLPSTGSGDETRAPGSVLMAAAAAVAGMAAFIVRDRRQAITDGLTPQTNEMSANS